MKDYQNIIIIILFAGLLLVTPHIIRYSNGDTFAVNGETYKSMRIQEGKSNNYDTLQERAIPFSIINFLPSNENFSNILFNIIPIILGLISVGLSYKILKNHNISEKTIFTILLLTIASPIFLYTFMDYKIYSFIIFFSVLGMYFLTKKNIILSGIFLGIVPLIDLWGGIITLLLILIYEFEGHAKKNDSLLLKITIFFTILVNLAISIYNNYNPLKFLQLTSNNILTDIGASIGFSFAIIILTIIGLILLWENGIRNMILYGVMLLMIVLTLFNDTARIFMNYIIVIYAGFAFIYLNNRKWSISIIKKTTVLLIICSIFFSSLVYITKIVRSEPTQEYINSLNLLKDQALDTEVILSHPDNGYMIEYYTHKKVFIDDTTKYSDKEKYSQLKLIASSRNLEKTEKILQTYNIKYIIIDKKFETYLKEYEGLLYLIETSGKFTSIKSDEHITIWMYTS